MTIAEKLIALGFKKTTDLGTKNGWTLVKVMTAKGWASAFTSPMKSPSPMAER